MSDAQLILPEPAYLLGYLDFCRQMKATGLTYISFPDPDKFDEWGEGLFERYRKDRLGEDLPEGYVPSTAFWLVLGGELIGSLSIRHFLNDALREVGGHIGYGIKPSRWRQGFGELQLRLGLAEANQLGIDRALITCNDVNIGSARVIEKNGGELEGIFDVVRDGVPQRIRRYWAPTPSPGIRSASRLPKTE